MKSKSMIYMPYAWRNNTVDATLTRSGIVTEKFQDLRKKYIMEAVLILLCIILGIAEPKFFTLNNLLNVLRNISMQGIIAFGMTMIIISGEIDLSVGSTVAFSGCLTAYLTDWMIYGSPELAAGSAISIAIIIAVIACFGFGCLTAYLRNHYGIPSFITTLALMTIEAGLAFLITDGFPITPYPGWFSFLGMGYVFGVPFPAIIFILVFIILNFLMSHTSFGRAVYAVGGNAESARLSGISVNFVKTMVFGITGVMATMAGVMLSAMIMSGSPSVAKGWELFVISAVIIGGASLFGGSGNIKGTLVGIIFLGVILNGMTLLGISTYWQYVVRGLLILAAVFINFFSATKK